MAHIILNLVRGIPEDEVLLVAMLSASEAEELQKKYINDLKSKNRELNQFTYTVSHDLRSPLVTINGFSKILEREIKKTEFDIDDMTKVIGRIQYATTKMYDLLNDVT